MQRNQTLAIQTSSQITDSYYTKKFVTIFLLYPACCMLILQLGVLLLGSPEPEHIGCFGSPSFQHNVLEWLYPICA